MTSLSNNVVICGLGAATPIGRGAWAAAAAVRGGISGFGQHPFMVDSEGEPIKVAQCPWLVSEPAMAKRLSNCLVTAVREAFAPVRAQIEALALKPRLWVNFPAPRPGLSTDQIKQARGLAQIELATEFSNINLLQHGHAGGCHAIEAAMRNIAVESDAACVVCGVDSYLAPDTLEWLDDTEQLHGAGPRNNAWGFVPGEGAGALLLMAADTARRARLAPFAQVSAVGLGKETKLIRTDTVCIGLGLTEAFKGALAGLSGAQRVTDTYCDMNGEAYRADEFGFSVLRTRERFVNASDCITPADCWGDVGAASVPLGAVLACAATAKRYANGPLGLVWASSEAGERGAALLQAVARS